MVQPRRLFAALPLFASLAIWARLQLPPEKIDLTTYLARAPIILRAEILAVSEPPRTLQRYVATARLHVTRWYRGQPPPAVELRFAMQGLRMINGHDCFNFPPGTQWLILAKERDGALELIDDCFGAFEVAPRLGAIHADPITQLEADYAAGLTSPGLEHCILSLQRLANLHSESSRPMLRDVIATGTPIERGWAIYAAIRTGDVSALTAISRLEAKYLPPFLYHEVSRIKDPAAIPALLDMANDSSSPGRDSARSAVNNMRTNERHL